MGSGCACAAPLHAKQASSAVAGVSVMPDAPEVSFAQAARLWAKVGLLSFGGAAGQIAMLHRFVVDERRWLDERRFLAALNFCTLLPGPEAQQLATYIGWRLHGVLGGLTAGLLFVLPGAAVMLLLSVLYVLGSGSLLVAGLFTGIKAAVLAIVAQALIRIGGRALRTPMLVGIAAASFVAIFVLSLPFPAVIVAAAVAGMITHRAERSAPPVPEDEFAASRARYWMIVAACLATWGAPLALAVAALGSGHILVEIGLFFSKLAVVTFGGAYAVLAYLAQASVERGWLGPGEMVDGLGLAETTPGPTILVNQFVGFLAAYRSPAPFSRLVAGCLGALMTVWVTFAPSFLWIFAGGPYLERIVADRRLAGALAAITAAVVGVIATLAVRFGLAILFTRQSEATLGPIAVPWPDWTSLRLDVLGLCALAAFLIFRLHLGVVATVGTLAALGLSLSALLSPIPP